MRTPRSRLPKNFSLEDRLAACAANVERAPETCRGRWHSWTPAKTAASCEPASAAADQASAETTGSLSAPTTDCAAASSEEPFAEAENLDFASAAGHPSSGRAPAPASAGGRSSSGRVSAPASAACRLSSDCAPAAERPSAASAPESHASYQRVVLDLGCGKGEYTVACAKLRPDTLFIGLDVEGVCVMRGAELALAEGVANAVFVWADDPDLATIFAPGELDGILMNFPTPYHKKKKAHLRLTYLDRLMTYRAILAPGASVRLRTDSLPFRDFSLTQLELAGYELKWNSDDVRALFPDEPTSAYEAKLTAQGAVICGFEAVPGPAPEHVEQTALLSLVSYLPEDIENLTYIPYGMKGYVTNTLGCQANRRAKGLPAWKPPIV